MAWNNATRRACVASLIASVLLVITAGCGGTDQRAPAGEASPAEDAAQPRAAEPAATPSTGPLSGEAVPVFPTPDAEEESVQEEPAGPRFPAPHEGAQLTRIVIPKARVNSRLVVKGLTPRREMEDPGSKDDVAWYNFSARPGFGSNAVLSGHVDWYTGARGVFWFLRDLAEGDEAEIQYSDGTVVRYRVVRVQVYGANDAPVGEITAPTTTDMLTMITCDGVFQRSSRDYTQRRVVWAERIA